MTDKIVSSIWIYPVKSLGGIALKESAVAGKGLAYDRRWLLVDDHNVFFTQRRFPQLTQFSVHGSGGQFVIQYDGAALPLVQNQYTGILEEVTVWDDQIVATEVSKLHSQWFSDKLGINCRLMFFPEENIRQVDLEYAPEGVQVSAADGYPVLIAGEASLQELNRWSKEPTPMNRFRPNIVFSGGRPFEEDEWGDIRIGEASFRGVKPCARCVVTTIDQSTGLKSKEPLHGLAQFRKKNNKVYFGQNLLVLQQGGVCLGDLISVGS